MNKEIIKKYSQMFEDAFNGFLPMEESNFGTVTEAMRYSFLLGGKRIRPCILMEFFRICGGKDNLALPFAVALEMIHTYSLIHDDLPCMDDDDMRRGRPSNHIVYGEDMALLAGDGLLTHAFSVASSAKGIKPEYCLRAINELSILAGYKGMIGGQVIDLQSEGKDVPIEIVSEINSLKTAALLKAAAKIGVILAGGSEEAIHCADEYGEKLGLAFQIVDDILDCCGDEASLGKPIGSDEKNNKSTFVSHYGIEKCKNLVDELTDDALLCIKKIGGDTKFLEELTVYLSNRKN